MLAEFLVVEVLQPDPQKLPQLSGSNLCKTNTLPLHLTKPRCEPTANVTVGLEFRIISIDDGTAPAVEGSAGCQQALEALLDHRRRSRSYEDCEMDR